MGKLQVGNIRVLVIGNANHQSPGLSSEGEGLCSRLESPFLGMDWSKAEPEATTGHQPGKQKTLPKQSYEEGREGHSVGWKVAKPPVIH